MWNGSFWTSSDICVKATTSALIVKCNHEAILGRKTLEAFYECSFYINWKSLSSFLVIGDYWRGKKKECWWSSYHWFRKSKWKSVTLPVSHWFVLFHTASPSLTQTQFYKNGDQPKLKLFKSSFSNKCCLCLAWSCFAYFLLNCQFNHENFKISF